MLQDVHKVTSVVQKYTGSDIKREREKRGWTQRQLGDLLGVTNVAVSKWETNNTTPTYSHQVTLRRLFTEDSPEPTTVERHAEQISRLRQEVQTLRAEMTRLVEMMQRMDGNAPSNGSPPPPSP